MVKKMQNMKRLVNWVCHRNKVPIDPKTGGNAKSNDPNTWGTYEQAKELKKKTLALAGWALCSVIPLMWELILTIV